MTRYVNIEGDIEGIASALVEGVLIRMWGKLKAVDMHIKKRTKQRSSVSSMTFYCMCIQLLWATTMTCWLLRLPRTWNGCGC